MQSYKVTFTYQGSRYTETFGASSYFAARRMITSRFPGCSIWNICPI